MLYNPNTAMSEPDEKDIALAPTASSFEETVHKMKK
jgi:hypothetical protein